MPNDYKISVDLITGDEATTIISTAVAYVRGQIQEAVESGVLAKFTTHFTYSFSVQLAFD